MSSDRTSQLIADGFELIETVGVGLPHYVWKTDIEVEFDRELKLVEETVLRLIAARVTQPDRIAELMGLDDGQIVPHAIVGLLTRGAILHREGKLIMSPSGTNILQRSLARDSKLYEDLELRHDPYRNLLRWDLEEREYKAHELREEGLRALPAPGELRVSDLEARYAEVQSLLNKEGFPFDSPEERKSKRFREVVRLKPSKAYVAYRTGELEIWHRKSNDDWEWRFIRGGGEEHEVAASLRELEAEGAVIFPLDERRELVLGRQAQLVHEATNEAQKSHKAAVLQSSQHRGALRDAISDASRELIIVSPWLRTAAVDSELIGWLQTALERKKQLKITVAYGIQKDPKAPRDPMLKNQEEAIRRLRRIGERAKGRLRVVDIGNTHEKVVICDERYVIFTSFNFLSFNPQPGKGIRREMGYRVTDPATVAQVRQLIVKAIAEADQARVKDGS